VQPPPPHSQLGPEGHDGTGGKTALFDESEARLLDPNKQENEM
jgi:hypothetical protein